MITLNHCPDWIFDVVASAVAVEFLSSPLSLASVTQRFIEGMAEVYDEIETDRLMAVSENMILFLNEAEVGEASVDVLNSYCFFRIKFQMDKSPRKLGGVFGSAIKGEKVQNHDTAKSVKRFKAFLFALRNGGMPSVSSDWKLETDTTIPKLSSLLSTKTSILDEL